MRKPFLFALLAAAALPLSAAVFTPHAWAKPVYVGVEGGHIAVNVKKGDIMASIAVRDTGIGLSPEEAKMVFSRFWRADAGRNRPLSRARRAVARARAT